MSDSEITNLKLCKRETLHAVQDDKLGNYSESSVVKSNRCNPCNQWLKMMFSVWSRRGGRAVSSSPSSTPSCIRSKIMSFLTSKMLFITLFMLLSHFPSRFTSKNPSSKSPCMPSGISSLTKSKISSFISSIILPIMKSGIRLGNLL